MAAEANITGTISEVVPFLRVTDMQRSLPYYLDGLGFSMANKWIHEGKLRWCWLTKGHAALMLQEFWKEGHHAGRPEGKLGIGVSLVFSCDDALAMYRDFRSREIEASEPFVGNGLWNFSVSDPDGYRLEFASP